MGCRPAAVASDVAASARPGRVRTRTERDGEKRPRAARGQAVGSRSGISIAEQITPATMPDEIKGAQARSIVIS